MITNLKLVIRWNTLYYLRLGGIHKLRWQDEVGRYLGGTVNDKGMQMFPYNGKEIPTKMSKYVGG